MMTKRNEIVEVTFEFALDIIKYSELLENKKKFVLAKQILRSGTSVGANVRESQKAESLADFIHKLKIADKEVEEVDYWLSLCLRAPEYPDPFESLQTRLVSIKKLLNKIISSSKNPKK